MKHILLAGLVMTITLLLIVPGWADERTDVNGTDTENWIGTWTDANHTISIEQEGTELIGIGTPFKPDADYSFLLTGMISEDGTVYQTVMKSSGTRNLQISDDLMSFSGTGTVDSVDNSSEPYTYEVNATRNGTTTDPDNLWTGEWLSGNSSMILNQNGSIVTGKTYYIPDPKYTQEFEGTVSDDGKSVFMTWSYEEEVNFTLSENGMNLIETECGEKEIAKGELCFNLTKAE